MSKIYIYGIVILLAFGAGAKVNSVFAEKKLMRELAAQAKKINEECEKAKQLTERVDNDYQQKIAKLRADVKRARSLYKSDNCLPVSKASGSGNATTAGIVHGTYAINSQELIDYAEDAELVRIQLLGCQDYIRGIHE